MRKFLFFFILAAVISAAALSGFLGGKRLCRMMLPGSMEARNAYAALGLSGVEAEAFKQKESSFRGEADALCMRICGERLEVLKGLKAGNGEPQKIYEKIEAIGELQILLEKRIATHVLEVKKMLTPEQSGIYLGRIEKELREALRQSGYQETVK